MCSASLPLRTLLKEGNSNGSVDAGAGAPQVAPRQRLELKLVKSVKRPKTAASRIRRKQDAGGNGKGRQVIVAVAVVDVQVLTQDQWREEQASTNGAGADAGTDELSTTANRTDASAEDGLSGMYDSGTGPGVGLSQTVVGRGGRERSRAVMNMWDQLATQGAAVTATDSATDTCEASIGTGSVPNQELPSLSLGTCPS